MATDDRSPPIPNPAQLTDIKPETALVPAEPAYTDAVDLPEPPEPRPYIEIRPAETSVDPQAVSHAMALFRDVLRTNSRSRHWSKLRGRAVRPTAEWLLVSDGRPDPTVRYLVGCSPAELTEDLEGILRMAFPDSYEFRQVWYHPQFAEEHLPVVKSDERTLNQADWDSPLHPSITPSTPYVAGVEFYGRARRKRDWQTPLVPFEAFFNQTSPRQRHTTPRVPLAAVIEAMHDAQVPVVFQVVCGRLGDWSAHAERYLQALDEGTVTRGDKFWEFISPRDREARNAYRPPPSDAERIEGVMARDPTRTLAVSVRAAVLTTDRPSFAEATAHRLSKALSTLNGRHHTIVGQVHTDDELYSGIGHPPGSAIYQDLLDQRLYPPTYRPFAARIRRKEKLSRAIVVSLEELPGLCVLDGTGLTSNGRRAITTRPSERTGLPLPPAGQLARYRGPGLPLCRPLTHDRQPYDALVAIAPTLQTRHAVILGATGAGKSVTMTGAMLGNARTTPGASILLDLKGDGMAREYLKSHYTVWGSLEAVTYFDLTEVLPALSFFDIGPLLDAGIPREEATARKAGHYEEILKGVMGTERFEQAVVSPQVIATHIKALFDPVHGADAFSHRELLTALHHTQTQKAGPPVSDDDLERHFESLVSDDPRMFTNVMAGARTRTERIGLDRRLAPVFNHVPNTDETDTPQFDFADYLDTDHVLVFDFGDMEAAAKRTLTLVLLSALWSSLRARATSDTIASDDRPVVNLFLEEAASVCDTELVDTLLSQGRSFGLSVTLGLQFLGQLRTRGSSTYYEVLNETASFLCGNVAVDTDLAAALATDSMPAAEVENRLRALGPGEWLVRLGAEFAEATPRPFLATSLPAPPGHAASTEPLDAAETARFEAAFAIRKERVKASHGLVHTGPSTVEANEEDEADAEPLQLRVDSLLPYTKRLPECVTFDEERFAILCRTCESRYNPDSAGMRRAIECCNTLEAIDRDDVPVSASPLKLSLDERRRSPWSERQLHFIQVVHDARQFRTDPLEYDLLFDSMLRLQEYVGIESAEVDELVNAGLLRDDGTHPHQLYTVTAAGRDAIGEPFREGLDYGHGRGDLDESSPHLVGVELLKRYVEHAFARDPDSAAVDVITYFELDDGHRLDVAGIDEDGKVVVCGEVERLNHDYREAVIVDYDKMAGCAPEAAIWVVMTQRDGHKLVDALREAPDGVPRVYKEYGHKTPPRQYRIDEPGFSDAFSLKYLRDSLLGGGE